MGLFGDFKKVATLAVGKEKADALEKAAQEKLDKGIDIAKKKIGEDKVDSFFKAKERAYDELCARTNNMTYEEWLEVKGDFNTKKDVDVAELLANVERLNNSAIRDGIEMQEHIISKLPDGANKNKQIKGLNGYKCSKGICPDCDKETIMESNKVLINAYEKEVQGSTLDANGNLRARNQRSEEWRADFKCSECGFEDTLEYTATQDSTHGRMI